MPLHPQRSTRPAIGSGLFGDVVSRLGEDIVTGRIGEGQVLMVEQLCTEFGVSRSVVREALRTLASMGLIESRPQRGTIVRPMSQWDLLNAQVIRWRARGAGYLEQQKELLELRLGVEGVAARLAASRIPVTMAREILQHAQEMQRRLEACDRHGFFTADAQFHGLLVEGSGNRVIAQFADTIGANLMARSYDTRPGISGLFAEAVASHMELGKALVARDPDAAEHWARAIVRGTLEEFGELHPGHA